MHLAKNIRIFVKIYGEILMKKIVLIFGLITGLLAGGQMWLLMSAVNTGAIDFDNGAVVGYATMIIAFSMVFFGIKACRDSQGGRITFLKGLQVGILITLIASFCYAVSWELYYPKIGDEFMQKYTTYYLDKMKADGASDSEIQTARVEGEQFVEMYKNFFVRFAFSLIEILPVGIIVTLVSAGLLRRRELLPAVA